MREYLALCLLVISCGGDADLEPLVEIVDEPAGENCAAGGQAVNAGLDVNADGVLDADEITSVDYLCNDRGPTIFGSVTVHNSVEAEALTGVQDITGNLVIDAFGLSTLELPTLQRVGGDFTVSSFSGDAISLPALTQIGENFKWTLDGESFSAPALTTVNRFELALGGMATLDLTALATAGTLALELVGVGTAVTFPSLTHANNIDIFGNADLHFPVLESAGIPSSPNGGVFEVTGNMLDAPVMTSMAGNLLVDSTPTVNLPSLATFSPGATLAISGVLTLDLSALTGVQLFQLASTALDTLDLPAGTSFGLFSIQSNNALTAINVPAGFAPTNLVVEQNPVLPTCEATEASTLATNVKIAGNLIDTCGGATCIGNQCF